MRTHDDAESLELALIENMAREDLNPVEEARACALLVEELGLTREEVGRRVGRSRVAVSNLMRLLDLPDEVLDLLAAGDADRGPRPRAADGRDHDDRRRLARAAADEGWTVRRPRPRRARRRGAARRPASARTPQPAPPGPGGGRGAARRRVRPGARRRRPGRAAGRRATSVTLTVESLDEASRWPSAWASAAAEAPRLIRPLSSPPQRAISSVG